ncbi:hypothetical protein QJS10_CPB12g00502 [Acorus calamus]|uniref:Uncharacterized protein n=1 Tax=Acorus calamus TaxID=4465 RepID=A0AAV9DNB9_ACOCL|nr:hypothetical protein QJS10_CPB12g00502 [Acorus calamus]
MSQLGNLIDLVFLDLVKPHPHSPPKRQKRRISSTRAQRVSVLRLFDPALEEEEDLVILDLLDSHPPPPLHPLQDLVNPHPSSSAGNPSKFSSTLVKLSIPSNTPTRQASPLLAGQPELIALEHVVEGVDGSYRDC